MSENNKKKNKRTLQYKTSEETDTINEDNKQKGARRTNKTKQATKRKAKQ